MSVGIRTKSDKVDALRKQYEAFLEEDKRRKERNEYILGRLDKIRSCTSMVPFQPTLKTNTRQANPSIPLHYSERSSIPISPLRSRRSYLPSHAFDNSKKSSEETLILQEIINKYILIPKRDYYNTSIDGNNDWQSKYEILNHLKNIEKEDSGDVPTREDQDFLKTSNPRQNIEAIYEKEPSVLDNEVPVKDLSGHKGDIKLESQFQYDRKEIGRTFDIDKTFTINKHDKALTDYANLQNNGIPKVSSEITDTRNEDMQLTSAIQNLNLVSSMDKLEDHIYGSKHNFNSNLANLKQNIYIPSQEQNAIKEKKVVFLDEDNDSPTQTKNVNELAKPFVESDVKESKEIDNNQYPMEIINVSEFTPNDEVKLEDGVNVNPKGYHLYEVSASMHDNEPQASSLSYESNLQVPSQIQTAQNERKFEQVQNDFVPDQINNEFGIDKDESPSEPMVVPNTVSDADIEEFESEQNDMFYQEEPDGVYQQETEGYNSENYQQNENQYYEEQALPVEINEHEETSQMYDQNYKAQYETTNQQPQNYEQQVYDQQGYKQQQIYQENQRGYDQQPGYEHQQVVYDQLQQGYDQTQQRYDQTQQGYDQAQQGYDQTQQGYDQTQQGYDQTQLGYGQTQQGYDQTQQQVYDESQLHPYNQQQLYDQQQVVHDQQAEYNEQNYDQLQEQSYNTPQNIEQQLDDEEKYVEPEQINKKQGEEIKTTEEVIEREVMQIPS